MQNNKNPYPYIRAIGLALLLTFSNIATVIADDFTPPPTVPTEETPLPPLPPTDSAPTEEYTPEPTPTSLPEVQAQLPENTDIQIIVDGESEPLVTQQAETALLVGDPIWCPTGASPIPGAGGCTASYLTLQLLIDDIDNAVIAEPAADGTIWILDGADLSAANIFIDGTSLTTWRDFELTLQGGWDGTSAGNIIGTSDFTQSISISDWGASVFVNDISISNTTTTGLDILTSADIALLNISVSGNDGNGIYVEGANINLEDINATTNANNGVEILSTGNISIIGTNIFSDNVAGSGLYIDTSGDTNIADITAENNGTSGVEIYSAGNISIIGTNIVSDNIAGSGLYIDTSGDTDIADITAENNGNNGVEIYSTGAVTITGNNLFDLNAATGLYIEAVDTIDIENITSTNNGGDGASLATTGGDVIVAGINVFSDNTGTGLYADAGLDIQLEEISAEGNDVNGATLFSAGNVSLIGTNIFDDNTGGYGISIDAGGDVDIQDLSASDNAANGTQIFTTGNVNITGTNSFQNNDGDGLYIDAVDIDLEDINASSNIGDGLEILASGYVSLIGTNIFNDNNNNGIIIDAGDDIDLENITASNNNINGADLTAVGGIALTGNNVFNLNNSSGIYAFADEDIYVEDLLANTNGVGGGYGIGAEFYTLSSFTLVGSGEFSSNNNSGLYVDASGPVIAENITANDNGTGGYGIGAEIYTLAAFTLTGTNEFLNNNSNGLYVDADGDIDIENITANDNGAGGLYGTGAELYSQGAVSITGTNLFNNNLSDGLYIEAVDDIYIEYADILNNGGNGVYLSTTTGNARMLCGIVNGNAIYQIETNISGDHFLFLDGVNVDTNLDLEFNIGINGDQLILTSNGCFTYPNIPGGKPIEGETDLGVRVIYNADGRDIKLDCKLYDGTFIKLINGDAVFIPCPIVDSVRADTLPKDVLPSLLNRDYVSAMNIYISANGTELKSIEQDNVIWYINLDNTNTAGYEATYYDGTAWVDITYQITPFMTVLFLLSPEMQDNDYSILYWDGVAWVELVEGDHLGNGKIVKGIGQSVDGLYFQAEINFIGTFVLVEK